MKQHCQFRIRKNFAIVLGSVLGAGCSAAVYPASECKPPPPPLTVPNSPRSQCREVSTEHAKDWPQKYKDIQYSEQNAVYWMRAAFVELAEPAQKELKSDFASALNEVNSADGKYLQLVDATVGSNSGDNAEATKMLTKAVEKFMKFFDDNVKSTAMTSGAQKKINKAKAAFQQLRSKAEPAPAPSDEEGQGTAESSSAASDKEEQGKDESPSAPADKEEKE
jgi:hypothetical protein